MSLDEQPVQSIRETEVLIPAKLGNPKRVVFDCEQIGAASIYLQIMQNLTIFVLA